MKKVLLLAGFLACVPAVPSAADTHPVAGTRFTLVYHPDPAGPLAGAARLELVYVFNFWATRTGTRLALLENVLRPDTLRVHRAVLTNTGLGWQAVIDIPAAASVLSYYVTDGEYRDDNGEKTYAVYVYNAAGSPVRNAHYFMMPFLTLARAPLSDRVEELEKEVRAYPDNLFAYSLLFAMQLEQGKGGERTMNSIEQRLLDLERTYADSADYRNLAARTYYYVLRDVEKALEYKQTVPVSKIWPDVLLIYDREKQEEEMRSLSMSAEERRTALLDRAAPQVQFVDQAREKHPLSAYQGKVVVLLFWATTSKNSTALLGRMRSLAARHGRDGLEILPVNIDEDGAVGQRYLEAEGLPFPRLFRNGNEMFILGVDSIPMTYILDKRGIIRKIVSGFSPESEASIASTVESLL